MKRKAAAIIVILALLVVVSLSSYRVLTESEFLYSGTIEATKVDLSSRLASVVAAVNIKEGEKISAGQELVILSAEDLKITAETAAGDFERIERLYKVGSVSKEVYAHAKAKRDETAVKLSWTTIKSPSQGTVLSTYREEGEWVSPGTKILTLADLDRVWATIYVPQPMLAKISLGQKVDGFLPELDNRRIEGEITHINDEAEFTPKNVQTREERTRLVYGVKVSFVNTDGILKPGMSIEVQLPHN